MGPERRDGQAPKNGAPGNQETQGFGTAKTIGGCRRQERNVTAEA
jgi:hypothetical protein